MNNKAELLSKIKKLAEAGFYGEQTNAAEILERLKKKYGITDADIAEDVEEIIWIRYKTELEKRLIWQVTYMVLGHVIGYSKGCRTKTVGIKASKAKCIEIEEMCNFYIRAMNEDLQMFYDAFLVKNQIFPPKSIITEKASNKINPDDSRLAFMVEGLEKHERYKQITNQND